MAWTRRRRDDGEQRDDGVREHVPAPACALVLLGDAAVELLVVAVLRREATEPKKETSTSAQPKPPKTTAKKRGARR